MPECIFSLTLIDSNRENVYVSEGNLVIENLSHLNIKKKTKLSLTSCKTYVSIVVPNGKCLHLEIQKFPT